MTPEEETTRSIVDLRCRGDIIVVDGKVIALMTEKLRGDKGVRLSRLGVDCTRFYYPSRREASPE